MKPFSINGIPLADKGFYINLDSSKSRRVNVENQIKKFKIKNLNRFKALTHKPYHGYGATKSHLKILKNFSESDLSTIFIAEDDFDIREKSFHPNLGFVNNYLDVLKKVKEDMEEVDWDIIMFGCNPKTYAFSITESLSIIKNSTGAWAYIINKKAAKFLINKSNYNSDYLAIDDWLPRLNNHGFKSFMTNEIIIHHAANQFKSDIQTNLPITNYDNMIQGGYQLALHSQYVDGTFLSNHLQRLLTFIFNFDVEDKKLFESFRDAFESFPHLIFCSDFIFKYSNETEFDPYKYENMVHFLKDYAQYKYNLNYSFCNSKKSNALDNIRTKYYLNLYPDYRMNENNLVKEIRNFNKETILGALQISHSKHSPKPKILKINS